MNNRRQLASESKLRQIAPWFRASDDKEFRWQFPNSKTFDLSERGVCPGLIGTSRETEARIVEIETTELGTFLRVEFGEEVANVTVAFGAVRYVSSSKLSNPERLDSYRCECLKCVWRN
jgi:hypothetical protein